MRPSRALALMIALAATAAPAAAGPLPGYSYRTEARADGFVPAVGSPVGGGPAVFAATITGTGALSATFRPVAEWAPAPVVGAGPGAIGLGTLSAEWAADPGPFAAKFGASNVGGTYSGGYALGVWLRDDATQEAVRFAFRGDLGGGVEVGETGAVRTTFTNEIVGSPARAQTLGGRRFALSLAGAPELAEAPGEFRATVSVQTIAEAPEPASAALALAGLLGAGGWWVRFRVPSSSARVSR